MKQESTISIVLPAYKAGNMIEPAIKSVLNQTYQNIQLIVIENGPKDGVEEICHKLNKKENICYIYDETPNVSNARNIGLEKATGDYLAFIDADDQYETNFLETMLGGIQESDAQLITCGYRTVYSKEERLIDNSQNLRTTTNIREYLEVIKENYLFNELWNKLYITSIVKENNITFQEDFELGEDFIFNLSYLRRVKRANYINQPLYYYTDGQEGLKLRYRANKFEIEYALTKYLEEFYKERNYPMEYIYERLARVYYNGIRNIYAENCPLSRKEKNKELETFISSEQYQADLNFIKDKITNRKFKIAVNQFFLKGKGRIKLFLFLNNRRHK